MAITINRSSGLSGASEPLIQRLRDVLADATCKPHATNLGAVRDTLDLIKADRALKAYDREIERERRATTLPDGYEDVTGDAGLSGGPYAFMNLAGDIVAGYHTKRRMCLGAWNYYEHPEEFVPPEPYDQEDDRLVSLQVRTGLEVQADGRRGVTAVYDNVSLAWLGRFDAHIATATRDGAIPIWIEAFIDGKWVTKLRGVFVVEASQAIDQFHETVQAIRQAHHDPLSAELRILEETAARLHHGGTSVHGADVPVAQALRYILTTEAECLDAIVARLRHVAAPHVETATGLPIAGSGDVNSRAEAKVREALRNAVSFIKSQTQADRKLAAREILCATGEG